MASNSTTKRIYAPSISLHKDINPILGILASTVATACQSPAINPDALFKPYEHTNPLVENFSTGGPDGTYGYTIPTTANNVKDLENALWEFNTPTAGGNVRMFDCYNGLVKYSEHAWGLNAWQTADTIYCELTWGGPAEFVCPKNMAIFQDCYLAVAIFAGDSFRYAVSCQDKISAASGELIQILKSAVDLTPPTIGQMVRVIPFIASRKITATTHIEDLTNCTKWNINYKRNQRYIITSGSSTFGVGVASPATIENPYTFTLVVTLTNNYSVPMSGALYPVYQGFVEVEAAGYVYRDPVTDEIAASSKSQSFNLAAGASQTFQFTGLQFTLGSSATPLEISDVDVAVIRMEFPVGHQNTGTQDVRFQ